MSSKTKTQNQELLGGKNLAIFRTGTFIKGYVTKVSFTLY